jgi:hypothetical protein
MDAVDRFHIRSPGAESLHSRLISTDGTFMEVEGRVIEMQFRCENGYLVVTSDGNPFEEMVHFYLLSHTTRFLDGLSLGRMYHSGILHDTSVCDDSLEFSFFGPERWRLSIRKSAGAVLLPKPGSSVRSINGWLRLHYLQLERIS